MSTRLRTQDGGSYPIADVFVDGLLDPSALAKYGLPRLTATFAYAMFMANAAVSAPSSSCLRRDVCRASVQADRASRVDRRPGGALHSLLGR